MSPCAAPTSRRRSGPRGSARASATAHACGPPGKPLKRYRGARAALGDLGGAAPPRVRIFSGGAPGLAFAGLPVYALGRAALDRAGVTAARRERVLELLLVWALGAVPLGVGALALARALEGF